jgi:outer membrane protein assembly factor BamB
VVVGTSSGQLIALDRKTGKPFWKQNLHAPIDSEGLLFEKRIYIGNADGKVFCIDKFSGKLIWESDLFAASRVQPTINSALQLIYFHLSNNYIVALNSETGAWVWSHRQNSASKKTIKGNSQPLLRGDSLFVGFSSGELICFRASDGGVIWEKEISKTSQFSDIDAQRLSMDQQLVLAAYHGELISLNTENQFINWRKPLSADLNAMALAGNELFAATTDGKVQKFSAIDGNQLWTFDPAATYRFNQGVASTLTPLNDHILLAFSQGDLIAIDRQTGKPSARLNIGGGINSKVADDRESGEFYFLSNFGRLYAVKLNAHGA